MKTYKEIEIIENIQVLHSYWYPLIYFKVRRISLPDCEICESNSKDKKFVLMFDKSWNVLIYNTIFRSTSPTILWFVIVNWNGFRNGSLKSRNSLQIGPKSNVHYQFQWLTNPSKILLILCVLMIIIISLSQKIPISMHFLK